MKFYLDLKSTLKSTLISEKQFCAHIQVNLDFKTTWFQDNLISRQLESSAMSQLVSSEESVNNILLNDSLVT